MWSARGRTDDLEPSPFDLIQVDVDVRLGAYVWTHLWELDEWSEDAIAAVLRFAYGLGYCDALTESERGKLFRDHGCSVPARGHGGGA